MTPKSGCVGVLSKIGEIDIAIAPRLHDTFSNVFDFFAQIKAEDVAAEQAARQRQHVALCGRYQRRAKEPNRKRQPKDPLLAVVSALPHEVKSCVCCVCCVLYSLVEVEHTEFSQHWIMNAIKNKSLHIWYHTNRREQQKTLYSLGFRIRFGYGSSHGASAENVEMGTGMTQYISVPTVRVRYFHTISSTCIHSTT